MEEPAFVGVDLGGTQLKLVATSRDGRILGRRRAPTMARADRDHLLTSIVDQVNFLRAELATMHPGTRFRALGLAVPGVIDAAAGRVEFTVALAPDWNG